MPPRVPSFSPSNSSVYEEMPFSSNHQQLDDQHCSETHHLGIIFDLDGTLIAEPEGDEPDLAQGERFLRPAAIEFLSWCLARGHSLAIWTAAHSSWAHYVSWKLCTALDPNHSCPGGRDCQHAFDFCWSAEKLRVRDRIPVSTHGEVDGCLWCEQYRRECDRCECHAKQQQKQKHSLFSCPCRSTKDLRKVWKRKRSCSSFRPDRTVLVENTPQQCIHNYGNAVYVPTYTGDAEAELENPVFERMKSLILRMEQAQDVRSVERCHHGTAPHACFEQNWWRKNCTATTTTLGEPTTAALCQPIGGDSGLATTLVDT